MDSNIEPKNTDIYKKKRNIFMPVLPHALRILGLKPLQNLYPLNMLKASTYTPVKRREQLNDNLMRAQPSACHF